MSLFNNPTDVIIEAGNMDLASANNVLIESSANDFRSTYTALPTLEEGTIVYTEEAVPVFAYNNMAVVELENVVKFMESAEIENVEEAVRMIAEHYGIKELGVVIESDEELGIAIEEAKSAAKKGDMKNGKKLEVASNMLKDLKDKGLKIFKKPKKKSKKK